VYACLAVAGKGGRGDDIFTIRDCIGIGWVGVIIANSSSEEDFKLLHSSSLLICFQFKLIALNRVKSMSFGKAAPIPVSSMLQRASQSEEKYSPIFTCGNLSNFFYSGRFSNKCCYKSIMTDQNRELKVQLIQTKVFSSFWNSSRKKLRD
jgi:hypothetical protein